MKHKSIPLSKKNLKKWKSRLQESVTQQKELKTEGEALVNLYAGRTTEVQPEELWVDVNKYAPVVDQKKYQLFYNIPAVQLNPEKVLKRLFGETAPLIADSIEAVVNEMLGRTEMNVKAANHKVLFDVLCPSGIGAVEIGYRSITQPVTYRAGEINPIQPTVQSLNDLTGEPEEVENVLEDDLSLDVPIHEEWFWENIPSSRLLRPKGFKDTEYDKAPWLGYQFEMPVMQAIKEYHLDPKFKPSGSPEDFKFESSPTSRGTEDETVSGIKIWYRASVYDSKVLNPELFRELIFINGEEEPVRHEDSPHQTVEPNGKLSKDSQQGNPIHVLTIRDLTDSAHPPSDCALIRPYVRELSKGRSQMLLHRDRSIPMNWHDRNRVNPEDIQKWEKGIIGASIPIDGRGDEVFGEIPRASMKTENFQFDEIVNRDIREVAKLGLNQVGLETSEGKSATEQSIVESNAKIGLDGERGRVLEWFLIGVEKKLLPLIQRYMSQEKYIEMIGEEGFQAISQWKTSQIPAKLAFEVMPDSGAHIDAQVRLDSLLKAYEFLAKDPFINRIPILKEIVGLLSIDPSEVIVEQLPEAKPQPPNISLRLGDESMIPVAPQFPIVRQILEQLGVKITEEAIQRGTAQFDVVSQIMEILGQQESMAANKDGEHKGLAPKAEILSKRESTEGQDQAGNQMTGLPESVQ